MMDKIIKNPEIASYLNTFPRPQIYKVLELSLLYTVRTIQNKYSHALTLDQLTKIVPPKSSNYSEIPKQQHPIQQKLRTMQANIDRIISPSNSKKTIYEQRPTKRLTQSPKQAHRRPPAMAPKPPNPNPGKAIPKYLKNVESKIKHEVKHDISNYKRRVSWSAGRQRESLLDEQPERLNESDQMHTSRPNISIPRHDSSYDLEIPETRPRLYANTDRGKVDYFPYAEIQGHEQNSYYTDDSKDQGYNFQFKDHSFKTPTPNKLIKEPNTCPIEDANSFYTSTNITPIRPPLQYGENKQGDQDNEVIRIADEFLKNPFTQYLAKNEGMFSVPTSPKGLEQWMLSPETNLLTSIELISPKKAHGHDFSDYHLQQYKLIIC